ncbi:alpha/beta hydrolase [Pseudarthrobacter sulfonivorans]|uniref:alpha/beta fold hydrolase n=1 Tax=Pseudarthrobacter sulfonivorans TaxID=121292 RepID=UPI0028556118|nr:alpha/beta hydrolase [Pseudarthrobacter sulfonivorans]MDR6414917.1 pimeloyl-ACP methyl ester carboxylesterase [Pseudarthrobacter sulfonivorans]
MALTILGLLLVSTAANLIIESVERSNSTAYGEQVHIDPGTINVSRSGDSGPTLVLLSGLGTPAPALDFAPLIRELPGYRTVVVEGFGYGYSCTDVRPRSIENISEELHSVLATLGITGPYVLAGHSIAGFTTLYYANKYPAEVSAVIGIDPSVSTAPAPQPGATAPAEAPPSGNFWERMPSTTGLVRWAAALGMTDPDSRSYTPAEIDHMRMLTSWNFGNAAVADETNRVGENAAKLHGLSYPSRLPVLMLLSKQTMDHRPEWFGLHERQLLNVTRHELVVLDGHHYLHWTKAKEMAKEINEFLEPAP